MKSQRISSAATCRTLPPQPSTANEKPAFTDSRLSTQRQIQLVRDITRYPSPATSQMKKVIQRASPDEWFGGIFAANGNATISVYSHILSDGYGDAGQLGNATRELSHLKDAGIVQNVVPYATYDVPKEGTTKKDWRNSIIALCPGLRKRNLKRTDHFNQDSPKLNKWKPYRGDNKNWELQFPVPGVAFSPSERLLRIFEMGLSQGAIGRYQTLYPLQSEPLYHTGVANFGLYGFQDQAVGYIIPSYSNEEHFQVWEHLIRIMNLEIDPTFEALRKYLHDAWFVKLNNPANAVVAIQAAHQQGCPKIILQGENLEKDHLQDIANIPVHILSGRIPQIYLDCLMGCIGPEGLIYAGGEGMLVQALGVSSATVGLISQDNENYDYQLMQYYQDCDFSLSNLDRLLMLDPQMRPKMQSQNEIARRNSFFAKYRNAPGQPIPATPPIAVDTPTLLTPSPQRRKRHSKLPNTL